jgi:hypothetical protein
MLKGFILAIFFGTLIGFGTSSLLVNTNQKKSSVPAVISPLPTPVLTVIPAPILTIDYPKNESVINTANITVKGNTVGSSFVLISTVKDSYQTVADNSGSFSIDLSLDLGANLLKIKSISPDNTENSLELLVTYSTAKLE